MLIDRQKIADDIHKGVAIPTTGPFFPFSPAHDQSIKGWAYDVDRALELLADAGVVDVDGDRLLDYTPEGSDEPVQFKFRYAHHTARTYHSKIAVKIKEYMAKVGIEVTPAPDAISSISSRLTSAW